MKGISLADLAPCISSGTRVYFSGWIYEHIEV